MDRIKHPPICNLNRLREIDDWNGREEQERGSVGDLWIYIIIQCWFRAIEQSLWNHINLKRAGIERYENEDNKIQSRQVVLIIE